MLLASFTGEVLAAALDNLVAQCTIMCLTGPAE